MIDLGCDNLSIFFCIDFCKDLFYFSLLLLSLYSFKKLLDPSFILILPTFFTFVILIRVYGSEADFVPKLFIFVSGDAVSSYKGESTTFFTFFFLVFEIFLPVLTSFWLLIDRLIFGLNVQNSLSSFSSLTWLCSFFFSYVFLFWVQSC